jgi:hypothetical protein
MAPRVPGRILVAAALLSTVSCASRREPLPALEDYSDGVSVFAEELLKEWKAGRMPEGLFAPDFAWSGPLPGDAMEKVETRQGLDVEVYRLANPSPRPSPGGSGGGALRERLLALRAGFAELGRCESVLFDFRRKGDRREIVLWLLLTGRGRDGRLRQEGGKLRALVAPDPGKGTWRFASASLESWTAGTASEPLFEEVAARAGLTKVHRAFLPNAPKNIPIPGEHMPPGAAVLDYDGDGREDLFVAGGDGNRLYRNRGDGTYEDATAAAGVGGQEGEGIGALAFDYDNDGRADLYVTYLERPNLLYRNRGDGTFEDVAARAGVALNATSTSAAALDYDRDGRADLYVLVYGSSGTGPNIQADNAAPNRLFRNNGDGTFTDVSESARAGDTGWALAVQCADLDGDGWTDIYVANDFGNNTYLRNQGDGTFRNLGGKAGVLDPGFGMGVTVDDYDGDGRLDFYVSNYSFPLNWFLRDRRFPMPDLPYGLFRPLIWRRLKLLSRGSSLFRSLGDGRFERTSDEADVWDTSWSWGCVFLDADLDGRPDLFVVNGMVTGKNPREREIDFWNFMSSEFRKFEKGIPITDFGEDSLWGRPPKRFYRNRDGRHFDELAAVTGLESQANQRGLVVTDANDDGAPDLFATGFLQPPALWLNRNPSAAKSLVVSLEGDPAAPGRFRSTRQALGATVTLEAGGMRRAQTVSAGDSFLSSSSPALYFGLGDLDVADRLTVVWPSGRVTERRRVPAGRLAIAETAP